MIQPPVSKEFLIEHYIDNKESMLDIAKLFGSSASYICKKMEQYDIPRRNAKDSYKKAYFSSRERERRRWARLGCKVSEETRKKMSEVAKNRSEEYRQKQRLAKLGNKNPNWNGGQGYSKYNCEYRDWRFAIFYRDNFKCIKCGKHNGTLNAHHVLSYKEYPERRYALGNGITLCRLCHKEIHRVY